MDGYDYDKDVLNVEGIDFGIFGNDEIKRLSAIEDPEGINKPESYNNFEPVTGGLVDSRMGTTDPYILCSTCGNNQINCPGHFGHVKLGEHVYNIIYLPYLKKILSCVCIRCSKLLVYKSEKAIKELTKHKSPKARFNEIRNACKSANYCLKENHGCGAPVYRIRLESKKVALSLYFVAESEADEEGSDKKKKIQEILTPYKCYNILKNISDTDCLIMGLDPKTSRPENMIIRYFPVSPLSVRPSIKADFLGFGQMEDSLTHKIAEIVKMNLRVKKSLENNNLDLKQKQYYDDYLKTLQYHVATYIDNDSNYLLRSDLRNGQPVKSLTMRLKAKEGRIRYNLMGKRVDFSARTVIGPDPNMGINELLVPLKIAMNITFPETVTPQNIERLTELVRNGQEKYPGANIVFPKGNKKYKIVLKYRNKDLVLSYGDIVERHMQDGDYVLFNRQPSLHKLSMMAHRARIIPTTDLTTFKFNVSVTPPYNAD